MTDSTSYKKKLIEVAVPLDIINKASVKEKSIRHGHPSTIHLYWARRPLATCRAVIFSSIIDDPSENKDLFPTEKDIVRERKRLFKIIENFVDWENINEKKFADDAIKEIKKQTKEKLILLDPFCGGGSIPYEAQTLGIDSIGSDINPVAVLITKSLIEIPQMFWGKKPINPDSNSQTLKEISWDGPNGLIEDTKYYGEKLNNIVFEKVGKYYPDYELTDDNFEDNTNLKKEKYNVGDKLKTVAWVWARTVQCSNPACNKIVPLVRSFLLKKNNNKLTYIFYTIKNGELIYKIKEDSNEPPQGTISRNGAICPFCESKLPLSYIRDQFQKKKNGEELLTVITEGHRKKIYLPPKKLHKEIAHSLNIKSKPSEALQGKCKVSVPLYGMKTFGDLFTDRQINTITVFIDSLKEIQQIILEDSKDNRDEKEYAKAIITYLTFAINKGANYWSSLCAWHSGREVIMSTFGRQALAMVWDYTEANPFSNSSGNFYQGVIQICKVISNTSNNAKGLVQQLDVYADRSLSSKPIISTDPPYYDNICYADLSDFFYIWLRKALSDYYPELFGTVLTPKEQELVASPFRFKTVNESKEFFEEGIFKAFSYIKMIHNENYPITIFYAFKQSEEETESELKVSSSTGWETMLEGLLKTGFMITGTLPVRTELITSLKKNVSALASSIVIVCRPRSSSEPLATRREFITTLKKELPSALKNLKEAGIAPVDFAQSSIGPGMGIFSRYSKVLEADGTNMSVRTALQIINQELDVYLTEKESEMDTLTRFCIAWFEQFGWNEGPFGDANTLATAKGTAVNALEQAGIIFAKAGKVRLFKRDELKEEWDPTTDNRLTVWECVQYLIRKLEIEGEAGAANILKKIGGLSEPVKELSYRLYSICEKKGWAEDALAYNSLISSWQSVADKAQFAAGIDEETKKRLKDKSQRTLGEKWGE